MGTRTESLNRPLRERVGPLPLVGAAVLVLLLGLLAWRGTSWLFWAYNIERAGDQLEQGLDWPAPRRVDSLPIITDPTALEAARGHLAAAIRWRPTDPRAHRLAAYSYLAEARWLDAATAAERAATLAPDNPLLAWEAGLAYEALWRALEDAPSRPLDLSLDTAEIDAPRTPIETPFCGEREGSCYVGRSSVSVRYAAQPAAPPATFETLFLHSPARVRLPIELDQELTSLTFSVGLLPQVWGGGSDGARLRLSVVEGGVAPVTVFEREIEGVEVARGWWPASADLSPWSGRAITLLFEVDPRGSTDADWVGWGGLRLTTPVAAAWALATPRERMATLWAEGGWSDQDPVYRGLDAYRRRRWDEADRWFARAESIGVGVGSLRHMVRFQRHAGAREIEAALAALGEAVAVNEGWTDPQIRYDAWARWGIHRNAQQDYEVAEAHLLQAVEFAREIEVPRSSLAEVYRQLGVNAAARDRPELALERYRRAIEIDPGYAVALLDYGQFLYRVDPSRLGEAQANILRGLELRPESAPLWRNQILFWLDEGRLEMADALCRAVIGRPIEGELAALCGGECESADECAERGSEALDDGRADVALGWLEKGEQLGLDSRSSQAFLRYRQHRARGDAERAITELERAVELDEGWIDSGLRFEAWYQLGRHRYEQAEFARAERLLTRAIAIAPERTELNSMRAEANRIHGLALAREGRLDEALTALATALEIDPTNAWAQLSYARALYAASPDQIGAVDAALDRALELEPGNPAIWRTIIANWRDVGEADRADAICARAPATMAEEIVGLCPAP